MGEDFLTSLSFENCPPSTLLSMDSIAACHEESERDTNRQNILSGPPDINLPLSVEQSPPPQLWSHDTFDMLDVGLGYQAIDSEKLLDLPKTGRKCAKKLDSVWGAWFFFSFYFKPVLKDKSKCKNIVWDNSGVSGFDKSDLQLDVFIVQHDMENMYMWAFKDRPENALGKMQLRSYMNGHCRPGQRPFPFSAEKGFVRSHKMQRKQYRGLANPQCLHGIELVPSPNLMCLDEEEQKKWVELTGRDLNFSILPEAKEFSSWRNLPNTDFELERPFQQPQLKTNNSHPPPTKKLLNGSSLNLSTQPLNHVNGSNGIDLSSVCNKKRKDLLEDCFLPNDLNGEFHSVEPHWLSEFSGVMRYVHGPVTAAKTIYEDEEGYLILVTLPFAEPEKVKVHWWNNLNHGVVKISSVSTACMPFIQRGERNFKLTDPAPEHCPPGEFKREIPLPTRIPDDAKLDAYFDKSGAVLEINVPKHRVGPEEHEVTVCLRPPNEFGLS